MGKSKSKVASANAAAEPEPTTLTAGEAAKRDDRSLTAIIHDHDAFFARVIAMIPHELYKAPDIDQVTANSKFYKHRRLPLEASDRKLISKQRKQEKYGALTDNDSDGTNSDEDDSEEDVESSSSKVPPSKVRAISSKAQIVGSKRKADLPDSTETSEVVPKTSPSIATDGVAVAHEDLNADQTGSMDELRRRLQEKIANLRNGRHSKKPVDANSDSSGAARVSRPKPNKPVGGGDSASETKLRDDLLLSAASLPSVADGNDSADDTRVTGVVSASTADRTSEEVDIEFGLAKSLKSSKERELTGKSGSKAKRLQHLMEEVDKKRKRINELQSAGEDGKRRLKEEQWTDALRSASGERVANDPRKLKKAMKRIEKSKEKSSREWQERLEKVDAAKQSRLDKREQNIANRKGGKDSSAAAGKDDADQKKSKRAGFEGKKTDYLNSTSKPPAHLSKGGAASTANTSAGKKT